MTALILKLPEQAGMAGSRINPVVDFRDLKANKN